MTRPPWEVADIIRRAGDKFLDRYRDSLTWTQLKVLRAIARCRTAALGGHRDQQEDYGPGIRPDLRSFHAPSILDSRRLSLIWRLRGARIRLFADSFGFGSNYCGFGGLANGLPSTTDPFA